MTGLPTSVGPDGDACVSGGGAMRPCSACSNGAPPVRSSSHVSSARYSPCPRYSRASSSWATIRNFPTSRSIPPSVWPPCSRACKGGFFGALVSIVLTQMFITPAGAGPDLPALAIFMSSTLLVALVAEYMHRAEERAMQRAALAAATQPVADRRDIDGGDLFDRPGRPRRHVERRRGETLQLHGRRDDRRLWRACRRPR